MIPKFRAWQKPIERMREVTTLEFTGGDLKYIYFDDERLGYLPSDIVLMQSTGLFDKNGKEIFEGDLVTDEGSFGFEYWDYGTVFYDVNDACWCVSWIDNEITNLSPGYIVYGNIHENPVIK